MHEALVSKLCHLVNYVGLGLMALKHLEDIGASEHRTQKVKSCLTFDFSGFILKVS